MKGATSGYVFNSLEEAISIRAPNERSDTEITMTRGNLEIFQSALPMKGATTALASLHILFAFQSALPMKGATPP